MVNRRGFFSKALASFAGMAAGSIIPAEISGIELHRTFPGNFNTPGYPDYQDFGDMNVHSPHATGYIRIDWFTPDGLATWGDGRTFILGTGGYIEMRKYIDIAGREGGNHLFLVNGKETKYFNCNQVSMPYGQQLVSDVVNRTETAMTQDHCFLATELALIAQKKAYKLNR